MIAGGLEVVQAQLQLSRAARGVSDGLQQLSCSLQLFPGALQLPALPQRQAQAVSDPGLVLSLVDLLGDMKTLLQVADGLTDLPVEILNTT